MQITSTMPLILFIRAHCACRPTVFLFDDTQLVNETFLEDVNGILNTGEVPSLFNNEEMVAINEALTKPAQVCRGSLHPACTHAKAIGYHRSTYGNP